ncbi:odorant receptor Or2-like isoform X1 [Vespula maculifrons]|uniref:Odorant receptor Or2-like isoform X1 n=1 Tax=Vespula maculifrons TaxID=7453 RepID=A0ABD2BZM5_VESMC
MASKSSKYFSIKIARFLMKTVGFWYPETSKEKWILDGILFYTLMAVTTSLIIVSLDFYYSWGDFYAITYTACSIMPVIIVLLKISIFILHRTKMMNLIKYTQNNFWYRKYDNFGEKILNDIDNKGILLMCSFTFFVQGTAVTYTLTPIIGKNDSDRILPFKIWIDIPYSTSPYFETLFMIETLALIHTAVCFACFDNFLCLLNMHAAGQFKILQHKLETIFDWDIKVSLKTIISVNKKRLNDCIKRHNELINYVDKLENIFTHTMMCQLLISSIMLCVAGFQMFLSQGTLIRRMIFIAHTNGCFFQLFAITLTANELLIASQGVSEGAYAANWPFLPLEIFDNMGTSLLLIMIRAQKPCCITAGGFFPVSLETCMAVLKTAASYFTSSVFASDRTMNKKKFFSVNVARFLMKLIGFWSTDTVNEQRLLNLLLSYTIIAVAIALWIEAYDFYVSLAEFYALTYTACSAMPVAVILMKLIIFLPNRKDIVKLIRYTEECFWFKEYDEFGKKILDEVNKKGSILICCFTFCVQSTVYAYMLIPLIENIGKNESDRILPFDVWLGGVDIHLSPYFEWAFTMQIIALIHSGLCFCCFDIFLCLLNLTVAGQFKILQHRLEILFDNSILYTKNNEYVIHEDDAPETFQEFKRCVEHHRMLIDYVDELERIFAMATLCQLLMSSVMLCVVGFQVFVSRGIATRQFLFVSHTYGCIFQLFVITSAANEVIVESHAVGDAAYNTNWQTISYEPYKKIKMGIMMIMARADRPCYITAGGFFPVSLQTFMGVLSTATSYFTLLRKFDEDEEGSINDI